VVAPYRSAMAPPGPAGLFAGHFLSEPLRDWDVSRPAPYFGFEIPDAPGNYWYVWFDAPIGYMAATKEWCDREGEAFDDWWRSEETDGGSGGCRGSGRGDEPCGTRGLGRRGRRSGAGKGAARTGVHDRRLHFTSLGTR
jgi:hypothetical protein